MSCTCRTPKHLTNNEKNIETHIAYEDGDFDYGHIDATLLDISIFFVKPNGSIDYLIGWESVKKNLILIFTFIWRTNVDTSTNDEDVCPLDSATTYTILKSNKFFSCLIMRDINVSIIYSTANIFEGSGRAIIFLPRSWIETY